MNLRAAPLIEDGPLERRVHLVQGEFYVSHDADVVLTTTLGSCVAACLYDNTAHIGGMNHFLLPDGDHINSNEAMRYGAYAMELLINALLKAGARRDRLQAKLFGGAHLAGRLADIGEKNIVFAKSFLAREMIPFVGGSVGGRRARRVQYWPATGRARQLVLMRMSPDVSAREANWSSQNETGSVDFFEA